MLLKKVDSVAKQLMNRRETGLISLILLAQISNQMVFEIMTAVAFCSTGVIYEGWDRDMLVKDEEEGLEDSSRGPQIVKMFWSKVTE